MLPLRCCLQPMSLDSFVHCIVNILKNVKPSSVYDLLQMAISNPCEPFAAAAVEVLLQHDSQHVHLLHTLKDSLDPVFSGGGSSLAAGGSSVHGVVWVRVNQDCTAAQLLTQLMLASINSGHAQVLQVLTTVPAAQEISKCASSVSWHVAGRMPDTLERPTSITCGMGTHAVWPWQDA